MARVLLRYRANPHQQTRDGFTPASIYPLILGTQGRSGRCATPRWQVKYAGLWHTHKMNAGTGGNTRPPPRKMAQTHEKHLCVGSDGS